MESGIQKKNPSEYKQNVTTEYFTLCLGFILSRIYKAFCIYSFN